MAQPKLEYITLRVSEKIGDQVSSAGTDGEQKTAVKRLEAINDARSKIYNGYYNSLGADRFIADYKEFLKESGEITLTSLVGTKPANIKKIVSVKFWNDSRLEEYSTQAFPIPVQMYYESIHDEYSVYAVDNLNPQFMEFGTTFKILGGEYSENRARLLYLEDCVPALQGAYPDIPDPYTWTTDIIELAAKILLTDQQIYN